MVLYLLSPEGLRW